ncbi:MAG: hypothetical protein WC933_01225 [Candidatus Paceibacterota bacterium]|jgi:hypothetical protein
MNNKNEGDKKIERLLKSVLTWPEELKTDVPYRRKHDDNEGKNEYLQVSFTCDGDAWIKINKPSPSIAHGSSLRFRMVPCGGGASPRVKNALMILAYAIHLDNKDYPEMEGK